MVDCLLCQNDTSGSIQAVGTRRFHICISVENQWGIAELQRVRRTFAFAYPNLIVMFRTSSFLNRTVMTPDIAFTTVDFP